VARGKQGSGKEPISGKASSEVPVDPRAISMTQFERALIVVHNAFSQWTVRCGTAVGAGRFSSLDLIIIGFLHARDQKARAADISFALKIEDTYTVQYALKKLAAAHVVESQRSGKETLFQLTAAGENLYKRYSAVRSNFLLDAVAMLSPNDLDLDRLARVLRTISGIYEQAARNATSLNVSEEINLDK
jgi:predicted MarR family transcription regulator